MSNFYTLLLALTVILNSIEISLGMPPKTRDFLSNFGMSSEHANIEESNSQLEFVPDRASAFGVPHVGSSSSSSARQHPAASYVPSVRYHSPTRSSSPAEPPFRTRTRYPPSTSITPPTRLPSSDGHGYGLDQLQFIRFISYRNPQLQFELRKYNFPENKSIEITTRRKIYRPVPTEEQIVLSTLDGDVFSILDSNYILYGLYSYTPRIRCKGRAKINMNSEKVTPLTKDEIKATPVGFHSHYLYGYRIVHANDSDGSLPPAELPFGVQYRSAPSKSLPVPTKLPSSDGSGYELDQLQFIRLIPNRNPNQILKLQRYTFHTNEPLLLLEGQNRYARLLRQEYIVLSTSDGDIFAILDSTTCLAGIYTYTSRTGLKTRVKFNMLSGSTTILTTLEMTQIPVGRLRPISLYFTVHHVNRNPAEHQIN